MLWWWGRRTVNDECAQILQTSISDVQKMIFLSRELTKLLILPRVARWWRYWIAFLDIKYSSAKRTKRRSARPTFYRMTKATLKVQVGKNILSYIDDIVVASRKKETYISNLAETFTNIREARLKLNLEKCIFRITKGKVLSCCWWPNLARLEKLDHPVSYSRVFGFSDFHNRDMEGAKLDDLKIQCVLRHEKKLKGIKEPRWKKSKPKTKAAKIGPSGFAYRSIRFFLEQIESE
jgi:hypothetical protein